MKSIAQKAVQRLLEAEDLDWEPDPSDPDDSIRPAKELPEDWEEILRLHGFAQVMETFDYVEYVREYRLDGDLMRMDYVCRHHDGSFSGQAHFYYQGNHGQGGEEHILRTSTDRYGSLGETLQVLEAAVQEKWKAADLRAKLGEAEELDWEPDPEDPDDSMRPAKELPEHWEEILRQNGFSCSTETAGFAQYFRGSDPGYGLQRIDYIHRNKPGGEFGVHRNKPGGEFGGVTCFYRQGREDEEYRLRCHTRSCGSVRQALRTLEAAVREKWRKWQAGHGRVGELGEAEDLELDWEPDPEDPDDSLAALKEPLYWVVTGYFNFPSEKDRIPFHMDSAGGFQGDSRAKYELRLGKDDAIRVMNYAKERYGDAVVLTLAPAKDQTQMTSAGNLYPQAFWPSKVTEALLETVTDTPEEIAKEAAKAEKPASDEQAEAGNYAKGHVQIQGLEISIENAKGSTRSGVGKDDKPWSVVLPAHYGYVAALGGKTAARSKDGDSVDVYVGDRPSGFMVYVVNQQTLEGKFDEHKCMIGFESKDEAIAIYDKAFTGDLGPKLRKSVVSTTVDKFKDWLKNGDTKKEFVNLSEALAERAVNALIEADDDLDWEPEADDPDDSMEPLRRIRDDELGDLKGWDGTDRVVTVLDGSAVVRVYQTFRQPRPNNNVRWDELPRVFVAQIKIHQQAAGVGHWQLVRRILASDPQTLLAKVNYKLRQLRKHWPVKESVDDLDWEPEAEDPDDSVKDYLGKVQPTLRHIIQRLDAAGYRDLEYQYGLTLMGKEVISEERPSAKLSIIVAFTHKDAFADEGYAEIDVKWPGWIGYRNYGKNVPLGEVEKRVRDLEAKIREGQRRTPEAPLGESKLQVPENWEEIDELSTSDFKVYAGANDWERSWTWCAFIFGNAAYRSAGQRVWGQIELPEELENASKQSDYGKDVVKEWLKLAGQQRANRAAKIGVDKVSWQVEDFLKSAPKLGSKLAGFGLEAVEWKASKIVEALLETELDWEPDPEDPDDSLNVPESLNFKIKARVGIYKQKSILAKDLEQIGLSLPADFYVVKNNKVCLDIGGNRYAKAVIYGAYGQYDLWIIAEFTASRSTLHKLTDAYEEGLATFNACSFHKDRWDSQLQVAIKLSPKPSESSEPSDWIYVCRASEIMTNPGSAFGKAEHLARLWGAEL